MSTSPPDARVLLVGAGGIGAPAAITLGSAGLGTLLVADDDAVELSNLHRQVLFEEADVGRSKLVATKDALARRFPALVVEVVAGRVVPETAAALVQTVDLVLDGSDNFATRFLLADACALAGVPVVQAAAVRWTGTCFVGGARGGGPCYRCLFEDLPEGPSPDCATAGVLGPICGVIGAVAADCALRLLAGDPDVLGGIVTFDGRSRALRRVEVRRRADCPLCGETPTIRDVRRDRYLAPSCRS